MMGSEELGNEVMTRMTLLSEPPKNMDRVDLILINTYSVLNDQITQVLKSRMANYDHGECGLEISQGLNGVIDYLEAVAKGVPADPAIMGEKMDKIAFEALILALSSNEAAKEFRNAYDKMFDSLVNLNVSRQAPASLKVSDPLPVEILIDAKTDVVHKEEPSKPVNPNRIKRIRLKKSIDF